METQNSEVRSQESGGSIESGEQWAVGSVQIAEPESEAVTDNRGPQDLSVPPAVAGGSELKTENSKLETEPTVDGQPSAAVLYDADAEQRILFEIEFDGERYEVVYVLGAQTDNALFEYERQLNRRLFSADKSSGARDGMEQSDDSLEAAAWLFDDRAVTAEGFGDPQEELPSDWKETILLIADKADVIDKAYLATGFVPLSPAKPGKVLPRDFRKRANRKVILLRALFSGRELELTHERTKTPTSSQLSTLAAIQKQTILVGGTHVNKGEALVPAKWQRLASLYDQLGYKTTNYKGRVPAHHKARVVVADLASDQEAITKK